MSDQAVLKRCAKHVPEWRSDNPLDRLSGLVRCASCGMEGQYSGIMAQTPQAPDPLSSGT